MAGHSKWSQIKHKKAAKDARRGKLFTKLIREITVAARNGADPDGNPTLRTAIANAKAARMPADNIERAIAKGAGTLEGEALEEMEYEGYGPGGMAVIVRAFTDNKNRTVGDIRHLFSKFGGNLGETNSVAWMFDRRGVFRVSREGTTEERVMEAALEAGADDVESGEDAFEVVSAPEVFHQVLDGLEKANLPVEESSVTMVPKSMVRLEGEQAATALRLLDALDEHDDVQGLSTNLDVDPEELEKLTAA